MDARREEILKSLLQMAWADGEFTADEKSLLANVLIRLGYTAEEVEQAPELTDAPEAVRLEEVLPDSASRFEVMRDLIAISAADGYLTPEEYEYIMKLAQRLGISAEELERARIEGLKLAESQV